MIDTIFKEYKKLRAIIREFITRGKTEPEKFTEAVRLWTKGFKTKIGDPKRIRNKPKTEGKQKEEKGE